MSNTKRRTTPLHTGVAVGYCHGETVAAGFMNSLLSSMAYELCLPQPILMQWLAEVSGVNVSNGRNNIVRRFLAGRCEWLLMLDTDMIIPKDTVSRLVSAATENGLSILGGLCFGVDDGMPYPTLYDWQDDGDGIPQPVRYGTYPIDALFPVGATGAACLLVHRQALLDVAAANFNDTFPWFQESVLNGEVCGEDVTFCLRAAATGHPIAVHTGIKIGHQKAYVLSEQMYFQSRAAVAERIEQGA
jgi:GT2 family glycosyltransferase